jgi:putative ABC transport system ATP-binding protein
MMRAAVAHHDRGGVHMTTTTDISQSAGSLQAAPAARIIDGVKIYGAGATAVRALDAISADFAGGAFTAIMGPSGSGKSTLLHCLAGLDRLTSGQVLLGGLSLGDLDDKAMTLLRRERIGFVFQAFNLVPTLTARENVILPLTLGGRKPDPGWLTELTAMPSTPVSSVTGWATGPPNCPAGSSSGSRRHGRWSPALT